MPEYSVRFITSITAKSPKDLARRVEKIETAMTMAIGKKVHAYDYGELENKKTVVRPKQVEED